jgi:hypothetical protein
VDSVPVSTITVVSTTVTATATNSKDAVSRTVTPRASPPFEIVPETPPREVEQSNRSPDVANSSVVPDAAAQRIVGAPSTDIVPSSVRSPNATVPKDIASVPPVVENSIVIDDESTSDEDQESVGAFSDSLEDEWPSRQSSPVPPRDVAASASHHSGVSSESSRGRERRRRDSTGTPQRSSERADRNVQPGMRSDTAAGGAVNKVDEQQTEPCDLRKLPAQEKPTKYRPMTRADDTRLLSLVEGLPRPWAYAECMPKLTRLFPDIEPDQLARQTSLILQAWGEYRTINTHELPRDDKDVHAGYMSQYTVDCLYRWRVGDGVDEWGGTK